MKTRPLIAAICFFALAPLAAIAGPIYTVNRVVGTGFVTGTIETNGAVGVLTSASILGWNLVIDDGDGSGSFNLLNPGNSGLLLSGTLLTATADDIFFNFTGGTGFALFQNPSPGSGQNWWCVEGINSNCAGTGNSSESVNRFGSPTSSIREGNVSIATRRVSVPEPTTLAVFGLGLLGMGLARRKSKV